VEKLKLLVEVVVGDLDIDHSWVELEVPVMDAERVEVME
jgi:hypothetical protein